MSTEQMWPNDRDLLRGRTLDRLLCWCAEQDASRIELQTEKPVMIRVHGRNRSITSETTTTAEIEDAVAHFFRSSTGVSRIRDGHPLDLAHTVWWPDRNGRRHSFRINAIGCRVGADLGISITIRPLADMPRPLADQGVEPMIMETLDRPDGIFLICGPTGSGKTTLIGGINRMRLEDPGSHCNLLEGSEPLELLYDLIDAPTATVTQVEIGPGRDIPTFAEFIRAAMRREPTDIIVGECRDAATMEAAIQAGTTGHRVLSSLHTRTAEATVRRVTALCPADQRDSLTVAFVENLRLVVNQRLLPSTDGKRTPIREILPVSRSFRNALLDAPSRDHWPRITREAVETHGQSFARAIEIARAEGRISPEIAAVALRGED